MIDFENCVHGFFDNQHCKNIDIKEIYSDFSKTSKDSDNNIVLIDSEEKCINFDALTRLYTERHNNIHMHLKESKYNNFKFYEMRQFMSNDAIWKHNDINYFIEFKNTAKLTIQDLHDKIKGSVLIYLDIVNQTISEAKENLGYILVFNPGSLYKIHKNVKDNAKEKMDKCRLISSFEDLYFKDVLVMSKEEFEDFLDNKDAY